MRSLFQRQGPNLLPTSIYVEAGCQSLQDWGIKNLVDRERRPRFKEPKPYIEGNDRSSCVLEDGSSISVTMKNLVYKGRLTNMLRVTIDKTKQKTARPAKRRTTRLLTSALRSKTETYFN